MIVGVTDIEAVVAPVFHVYEVAPIAVKLAENPLQIVALDTATVGVVLTVTLTVLVLTVYDDDDRIFEAICAGACGYLLKGTPPEKLLGALREAVSGGAPMSPEIAAKVIRLFREFRPPEKSDYQLTPHETRVLKLLVEGHNFSTAAKKLGVTYHTIKFHMNRIYDKLQVHSKTDAVAKALRERFLD